MLLVPSPSHSGHAPNGLLNENSRGSISETAEPETGQANFADKDESAGGGLIALPVCLAPSDGGVGEFL